MVFAGNKAQVELLGFTSRKGVSKEVQYFAVVNDGLSP